MTNRILAASYKRGVQLNSAGCPLDYPKALPGHSAAGQKPLCAEQLAGYFESCVYLFGPLHQGYLIGLRLGTDCSTETTIAEWSFEPPWPDIPIFWDYEPRDVIPKLHLGAYRSLLDSPLMGVLNNRRLLRRGYPVEGLLCGYSYQPIPESRDRSVSGKLKLVDDKGNTVALRIALAVVRPRQTRSIEMAELAVKRARTMHALGLDGDE
jgi:hypothetical protein